ncbi:MAG: hypothetical protein UR28_C0019G0035 [Candidatus Peregrinibacteria bacterium GW2011_GWF2_33_10]|nr:MAG: hypothetical protein UR28_C0019G0035 [Candidatus Peregrinibacteria bacterium GW2011_GWF2_33_10]OGJ43998.1 MAG: hypothetical protein A2272_05190 [Candidatus Peregrinibacteria bacterium RIFOXYA12_FULL_33_12]
MKSTLLPSITAVATLALAPGCAPDSQEALDALSPQIMQVTQCLRGGDLQSVCDDHQCEYMPKGGYPVGEIITVDGKHVLVTEFGPDNFGVKVFTHQLGNYNDSKLEVSYTYGSLQVDGSDLGIQHVECKPQIKYERQLWGRYTEKDDGVKCEVGFRKKYKLTGEEEAKFKALGRGLKDQIARLIPVIRAKHLRSFYNNCIRDSQ